MMLNRAPLPALRPYVKVLWATKQTRVSGFVARARERVLPTGHMHIVIRLSEHPLRLYENLEDLTGRTIGRAVVGGARATYYLRDVTEPSWSVGAQLCADASPFPFGLPADQLAGRHTPLEELWGPSVSAIPDQLLAASSPELQIDFLESLLLARLSTVREVHPVVSEALARFQTAPDVGSAVEASGYSHRRFIALFRQRVGLSPKLFCRIVRFQKVLDRLAALPEATWLDLAWAGGYSDQAHFNREFREFAGITPGNYREICPHFPNHVPLPQAEAEKGQFRSIHPAYASGL